MLEHPPVFTLGRRGGRQNLIVSEEVLQARRIEIVPVERGAWVGRRKLGSVGITIRRGITFHGLALNVNTDLEPFAWINPCGIQGCTMTSLARESGRAVDMTEVRARMAGHLEQLFGLRFDPLDWTSLEAMLRQ